MCHPLLICQCSLALWHHPVTIELHCQTFDSHTLKPRAQQLGPTANCPEGPRENLRYFPTSHSTGTRSHFPEPEFTCRDILEFGMFLLKVTPCQWGLKYKEEVSGGGGG